MRMDPDPLIHKLKSKPDKGILLNNYNGRLLLVDDDDKVRRFYSATFNRAGYIASSCENLEEMRDSLQKHSYDAVFLDLNLGAGENGLAGLPYVLKNAPFTKVFILSSQNNIDKAVDCMDRGATWYFTKGTEPQEIIKKLASFFESDTDLNEDSKGASWRENFIGTSSAIVETFEMIERLKDVDSTVLILGESGTGKEVVARALHQSSQRRNARFEAINCGAIPENLLESELFGHKKGSFTDAKTDRKGIFEICSDGTLLLDEIGDMPLALQTKLLRVLQEKKVMPVGATSPVNIEARVIAATHRNVLDEVKSGRFREDLYYRLSVIVIEIPALRHRRADISLLVEHFLGKFNQRFGKEINKPSAPDIARLESYEWPGNVRELQNAVERGVVLSTDNELRIENMFSHFTAPKSSTSNANQATFGDQDIFKLPLTEAKHLFEKTYIEKMLSDCHGNVAELARRTGRYRADLYRMLDRYSIDINDYRSQ